MKRSRKPRDLAQLAKAIVDEATSEIEPAQESPISLAARLMSKLGSSRGGIARAAALAPEQRKAIAKKAAKKRWGKKD